MAINYKLITCLLLLISESVRAEMYLALCSCHCHVVTLPLKVVTLLLSLFVKVIALQVTYFQLTILLPVLMFMPSAMPGGALKHSGKSEVLCLIGQMEDCFDQLFEFNPEAINSTRRMRGASTAEPGQWGYGINVYGKRQRYQAKASEKSTLNICYVWVWVRQGINLNVNLQHLI